MPNFVGRLVEVGIGKEGMRGTGVAATLWIPKTTISFDDKIKKAIVTGSYGSIAEVMTAQVVKKWAEGDIEGEINANSFGILLIALLGTAGAPSTLETGVYSHSFTLDNDVDHPSLSIHVKDPIGSLRFRLAMLNSLQMKVVLGDYVRYTAGFISKVHQDETTVTPTYSIDHRFAHPGLTFKVATKVDDLAAASKIDIKELTLSIEKNVTMIDALSTLEPTDILNTSIKISGNLSLDYTARTWRDYVLNGNVKAMQIKFEGKLIGATYKATLDMQFPKVHFFEWEPSRALGEIASESLNFEIMYDLSNTRLWSTFQLINTYSTQY